MEEYVCMQCRKLKERADFHETSHLRNRPVANHCKACRADDWWNKKLAVYGEVCGGCDWPAMLADGLCSKCLKLSGRKKCVRCEKVKDKQIGFYPKRSICLECMQGSRVAQRRRAVLSTKRRPRPISTGERQRDLYLRNRYGISLTDYWELVLKQKGVCGICGGKNRKALAVDHDHSTGKIRMLLCDNCNLGLGNFRDNPEFLRKAAAYVEVHR